MNNRGRISRLRDRAVHNVASGAAVFSQSDADLIDSVLDDDNSVYEIVLIAMVVVVWVMQARDSPDVDPGTVELCDRTLNKLKSALGQ